MDFLLYLTPIGHEILLNIKSKKYKILENAAICRKHNEIFGFMEHKKFIICTDNIKNNISPVKHYVNETIYHEAVHVAQSCRGSTLGLKNIKLAPQKYDEVKRSTIYSDSAFAHEVEAYYLEDKPKLVLSYLKKYCF
jgi:hypothetical protein